MKEIPRDTDFFLGKKKNRTERNLCRNIFPFEKKYCTTYIFFSGRKLDRFCPQPR